LHVRIVRVIAFAIQRVRHAHEVADELLACHPDRIGGKILAWIARHRQDGTQRRDAREPTKSDGAEMIPRQADLSLKR